ncbi:hypothetical protein GALMADRAFT_251469 [Galerina marginata CBS 339.88]|uniref:Uncharacterized protein n=1 Tax=Galerina marginata (strain CBS 339.88) TaxID=685588 RepID=A0A067T169_GALM3|nr:hypothetical protein GALMADRAFT_251469 [Galerina marginata CBS 339.88]
MAAKPFTFRTTKKPKYARPTWLLFYFWYVLPATLHFVRKQPVIVDDFVLISWLVIPDVFCADLKDINWLLLRLGRGLAHDQLLPLFVSLATLLKLAATRLDDDRSQHLTLYTFYPTTCP